MATHIELHHIGEVVLVALFQRLSQRSDMLVPWLAHTDCTLERVLRNAGVGSVVRFVPSVPLAASGTGETRVVFDGAHAVDVLAHDGSLAVAMEAKLLVEDLERVSP